MCVDRFGIMVAAGWRDREQPNALPVDEHLDFVWFLQALDLFVTIAGEAHLNFVTTILWENIGEQPPTARADRESFDVALLRDVGRHSKRVSIGSFTRSADGEARDFLSGGHVAVEQRWREITH